MRVITTKERIKQYRETIRKAIRTSSRREDISHLVAEIQMKDDFLLAKNPRLFPQCDVCGQQSAVVVLINEMSICNGCLNIASKLGEQQ